jgi:ribosomal protein S18 acetylase RimI-like enzyme
MGFLIREYRPADVSAVRQCVVELQDFERALDSRLRPGETMADAYCERIHARCAESDGRVFVAEQDESVVGFVAVFSRESFTELDEPPGTYAFISDLVVLSPYRGRGIGRQLLQRAEAFAREADARELRIGVLAENLKARRMYLASEFVPHLEILVKRW